MPGSEHPAPIPLGKAPGLDQVADDLQDEEGVALSLGPDLLVEGHLGRFDLVAGPGHDQLSELGHRQPPEVDPLERALPPQAGQ